MSRDTALAGAGRIVTDVRFDGVDEPAFRDPALLARDVRSCARVEVRSDTPASLTTRGMGEASDARTI